MKNTREPFEGGRAKTVSSSLRPHCESFQGFHWVLGDRRGKTMFSPRWPNLFDTKSTMTDLESKLLKTALSSARAGWEQSEKVTACRGDGGWVLVCLPPLRVWSDKPYTTSCTSNNRIRPWRVTRERDHLYGPFLAAVIAIVRNLYFKCVHVLSKHALMCPDNERKRPWASVRRRCEFVYLLRKRKLGTSCPSETDLKKEKDFKIKFPVLLIPHLRVLFASLLPSSLAAKRQTLSSCSCFTATHKKRTEMVTAGSCPQGVF